MIGDRDLLEFRRGYYDLLAALLAREPSADLLRRLAEGLPQRTEAARELKPALGEGWEAIGAYLAERPLAETVEAAADEFTRLFLGPRDVQVHPYESYYLTGRFLDRPLAVVREFLREVGLEREPTVPEPEDFLAFELSVMARLIARQGGAGDPDGQARWLNAQARFLKEHLLVWGSKCAEDLAGIPAARLYRGVGRLLEGFLQVERDLFREWGPEPIRTLEEARAAFRGTGVWRGPLFDATPGGEPSTPASGGDPGGPPRPRLGLDTGALVRLELGHDGPSGDAPSATYPACWLLR